MEAKKNNMEFSAPETKVEKPKTKKFLGFTGKQWAGIGITAVTFVTGVFIGHKAGKKAGKKEGYVTGRCVGAIVNNCPQGSEAKVSAMIGADVVDQKNADVEFVNNLRDKGGF